MKVLQVVQWLAPGGIELMLLRALPHLRRAGVQVDICCLGPPRVLDPLFEAEGCRLLRVEKSANCNTMAGRFRRLLSDEPYDVVHSNFGYTSGGICRGAQQAGTPSVVSVHSCEPLTLLRWRGRPVLGQLRAAWLRWHRRLMEQHARMFLCHSQANLVGYTGQAAQSDRYRVIDNGVPTPTRPSLNKAQIRRELSLPETAPLVLHVGSFKPEKNHEGLLRIFDRITAATPDAQLVLVGDGALRPAIAAQAESLGLADRVVFAGAQADVWPYYHSADAFLFPSLTEGFGCAPLEAAMAGVPLVASDLPALRESVPPCEHRFLFDVADEGRAAELVRQQLAAAESGANPWVAEANSYAREHFSIERFTDNLLNVYGEVAPQAA
ncbi:MAG: glycosyltransferase family 4 protein [Planctomycetota bacterium]